MTTALLVFGFTALLVLVGILLERFASRGVDETFDPWPRSDRGGRRD